MSTDKQTPMMKQFYSIKADYTDCILFFRLGDFYEMFGDDAIEASKILDITLTSRTKAEDALPMCGIPYHSAESYIAKLNQKGKKVAICEQFGDPKAPGIVERKVARVVTPSTNLSDYCLEQKANQFTASIVQLNKIFGLTLCDVSTGELLYGEYSDLKELISALTSYSVKEIVGEADLVENPIFYQTGITISPFNYTASDFSTLDKMRSYLIQKFHLTTLNPLGIDNKPHVIASTVLVLNYLESLLKVELTNITTLQSLTNENFFELDKTTIQNLEIFYTSNNFERKGSLLHTIDFTKTAAAGRLLKTRIIKPSKNINVIQERLDLVEEQFNLNFELSEIHSEIASTHDLERLVSRISLGVGTPRDLYLIKLTLQKLPTIREFYASRNLKTANLTNKIDPQFDLLSLLESALSENPPLSKRDANIFKDGYDSSVDEYRKLLYQGKDYILNLQKNEIEKTGIPNLKISFNKVFGYYIEVSNGKTNLVPDYFIRKQTLTNSERYITPELKEYEEKVLHAEGNLKKLEEQLFEDLIIQTLKSSSALLSNAKILAELDLNCAFAQLAKTNNYIKPKLTTKKTLQIQQGRHPVIENTIPVGTFIPNNCDFATHSIKLITGPNMGGKSTYLRQTAIIVLLAQMGSFVPATEATIGIVDQIFTRVGASDNLTKGLSTFMVEMEETAFILKNATSNSLLILDEIGRGTSTFDGVSLAWAILEYLHNSIAARTLFATHYHELIDLAETLENAENLSVAVEDESGTPVFLHRIQSGAINKSYGVHVATMAGIPAVIVDRANGLLIDLEEGTHKLDTSDRKQQNLNIKQQQEALFDFTDPKLEKLRDSIKELDINSLTPLEALQELFNLKNSIE